MKDFRTLPFVLCFTADRSPSSWNTTARSLDNQSTTALDHMPNPHPDKHITVGHSITDSHQNWYTIAARYNHTAADHMSTHPKHIIATISATHQPSYSSLNRTSSCFLRTLGFTTNRFELSSSSSNSIADQDQYNSTIDQDLSNSTADIVHSTFATGFVLANFTVADFDWTSFVVQYSCVISYSHIVIVVDVDSMFIAGFDSETVLGLHHVLFAVAIDLFAVVH